MIRFLITIFTFSILFISCVQEIGKTGKIASKPLFRDPIYDGAADPVVIWNQKEKKWFMFYTNRRANVKDLIGVTWVHGSNIREYIICTFHMSPAYLRTGIIRVTLFT